MKNGRVDPKGRTMKEIKTEGELNRGKGLVEAGLFLLILNVLVAARLWEGVSHQWMIAGDGPLLEQAWIRQGQELTFIPFDWENSYVFFLRFLFSFFGNRHSVVILANMALQLLGFFLFYRGFRRLTNELISLLLAAVLAFVSIYDFSIVRDSAYHLMWFCAGVMVWLVSLFRPIYLQAVAKKAAKPAEAEQQVTKAKERRIEEKQQDKAEERRIEEKQQDKAGEVQKKTADPIEKKEEKEEKEARPKPIPNPLPLPKKRIRKEMDYAFEPPKELMHYDLNNYNVNDDYDLKDV